MFEKEKKIAFLWCLGRKGEYPSCSALSLLQGRVYLHGIIYVEMNRSKMYYDERYLNHNLQIWSPISCLIVTERLMLNREVGQHIWSTIHGWIGTRNGQAKWAANSLISHSGIMNSQASEWWINIMAEPSLPERRALFLIKSKLALKNLLLYETSDLSHSY